MAFDWGKAHYIKGSAALLKGSMKEEPQNSLFNLKLDAVLEDAAPGLKITGTNYDGANRENHGPLHREHAGRDRWIPRQSACASAYSSLRRGGPSHLWYRLCSIPNMSSVLPTT